MGPSDLVLHLLGFVAPAVFLALALPLVARLLRIAAAGSFWVHAGSVFTGATLALAAGLWWFGRDGKMATYAAAVLVAASAQWIASRAWK